MPLARRSNSRQVNRRSPWTWALRVGEAFGRGPPRRRRSSTPAWAPCNAGVDARRSPMDFELPPDDDPRRNEVRAWLADHPKPSGRQLAEAGYVAPHWPRPWGLDADPIHQLIIDDELKRAGVSRPSNPIGIGWAGPTILHAGIRGAEAALPVPAARRRGDLVPAVQRARRRQRPRRPRHPGRARRRRVGRQRPEDLDLDGPPRQVRHPHRPHRPRRSPSTRASRTSSARWTLPGIEIRPIVADDRRRTISTRCSSPTCASRPPTWSARRTGGGRWPR